MSKIRVIKFKNGELVIGKTVECSDNIIEITDPIAVMVIPVVQETLHGETFLLKPWIGICSNKKFAVPVDTILTIGELKLSLIQQYTKYIESGEAPELPEEKETAFEQLHAALLKSRNLLN